MLTPDDEAFNRMKLISMYTHACSINAGLLPLLLDYNALRRLLEIHDEEIGPKGEDVLSPIVANQLRNICKDKGQLLDPNMSLAALAEAGQVPKSYQGRCLLTFDMRDKCSVAGVAIACRFMIDETIGTARFDEEYILKHELPTDLTQYLLIDVICSRKPPSALLSVLFLFKKASQTRSNKLLGLAAICINKQALSLFAGLGFHQHEFRERGATRWLVYLRIDELNMRSVASRLKFEGSETLFNLCYRRGLTSRSKDKIIGRCG